MSVDSQLSACLHDCMHTHSEYEVLHNVCWIAGITV